MNRVRIALAFALLFFIITPFSQSGRILFSYAGAIEYEWTGKMELGKYNRTEVVLNFDFKGTHLDKDVMVFFSVYAKNGHDYNDFSMVTYNRTLCDILKGDEFILDSTRKCAMNKLPSECPPEGFEKVYYKGINCRYDEQSFLAYPIRSKEEKKVSFLVARKNGTKLIQFDLVVMFEKYSKRRNG